MQPADSDRYQSDKDHARLINAFTVQVKCFLGMSWSGFNVSTQVRGIL